MMARRHTAEETKQAMHLIVGEMYDRIVKGEPPTMTLPVRTKTTSVLVQNLAFTNTARNNPFEMRPALVRPSNCFAPCTLLNSSRKC